MLRFFLNDSQKHEESAKKWLKATICFGIAAGIVAVMALVTAFVYHPPDLSATDSVRSCEDTGALNTFCRRCVVR